jgi:uncharacterized membrane protein
MDIGKYAGMYLITLAGFLIIDFIWLGIMNERVYQPAINHLMADSVNFIPALAFYVFYVVGVLVLAVMPGLSEGNLMKTLLLSALLGFVAYGTYDFTNFATLKEWPLHIVVIDVVWGATVTSLTGLIGYYAGSFVGI